MSSFDCPGYGSDQRTAEGAEQETDTGNAAGLDHSQVSAHQSSQVMGADSTREDEDGPGFSVYQVVAVPPARGERTNQSRGKPCIKPVEQAVQKLHALDSVGMTQEKGGHRKHNGIENFMCFFAGSRASGTKVGRS